MSLPAYLATYTGPVPAKLATAALVAGGRDFPYVSIGANQFTGIEQDGTESALATQLPNGMLAFDFILVDANPGMSRIYYAKGYDPASVEPPVCWTYNGQTPDVRVPTPCSRTCAGCDMGKFGSAVSRKDGVTQVKACNDRKDLAVLAVANGAVYAWSISPTNLKSWSAFVSMLVASERTNGVDAVHPSHKVIRAAFKNRLEMGAVEFSLNGWISEEQLGWLQEEWQRKDYLPWIGADAISQQPRELQEVQAPMRQAAQAQISHSGATETESRAAQQTVRAEFVEQPAGQQATTLPVADDTPAQAKASRGRKTADAAPVNTGTAAVNAALENARARLRGRT